MELTSWPALRAPPKPVCTTVTRCLFGSPKFESKTTSDPSFDIAARGLDQYRSSPAPSENIPLRVSATRRTSTPLSRITINSPS